MRTAAFHSIDADRAAVIGDLLGIGHRKAVIVEEADERLERVIFQVLVIDRIVLRGGDEIGQIMRFGDEDAALGEERGHAAQEIAEIGDMGEHIGRRDRTRMAVAGDDAPRDRLTEERLDGLDPLGIGDGGDIGGLDAERAHALVAEALEQRAIVRADVDAQRAARQLIGLNDSCRGPLQVAHQRRRDAAAIGVVGVKKNLRRDGMVDLREAALAALQKPQRIDPLHLVQLRLCQQRVAGRLMAEIQHRREVVSAADLATIEMAERQVVHGRVEFYRLFHVGGLAEIGGGIWRGIFPSYRSPGEAPSPGLRTLSMRPKVVQATAWTVSSLTRTRTCRPSRSSRMMTRSSSVVPS